MELFKQLKEMSREDLLELLDKELLRDKGDHHVAVKMGSHGVSPTCMHRYIEATEKIRAYETVKEDLRYEKLHNSIL